MNYRFFFKKTFSLVILTSFLGIWSIAQTVKPVAPQQNTLLNGLKVLVFSDSSAEKVTIKLRIHSGAAFDPKDKMGVMALLGDIIFPTEQAKAFFVEDLEGSLDISTNYDYVQITATGKSDELLSMLETISNAVINPQITPETFKTISEARLKAINELEKNPAYLADQAVAKRLFGEFPYGRSIEGTTESLAKIDHADIIFAKERFLTSDNASIAIIGNVQSAFAFRAARQLFGGWVKADKKVPATFRQPDPPNVDFLPIEIADTEKTEMRIASRGIARNDKDYWLSEVLKNILQDKFRSVLSEEFRPDVSINNQANILPGMLEIKMSIPTTSFDKFSEELPKTGKIKDLISQADFEKTKTLVETEFNRKLTNKISLADLWLDVDTYKTTSVLDQANSFNKMTFADLNKLGDRLLKDTPKVGIAVLKSENKSEQP